MRVYIGWRRKRPNDNIISGAFSFISLYYHIIKKSDAREALLKSGGRSVYAGARLDLMILSANKPRQWLWCQGAGRVYCVRACACDAIKWMMREGACQSPLIYCYEILAIVIRPRYLTNHVRFGSVYVLCIYAVEFVVRFLFSLIYQTRLSYTAWCMKDENSILY